VTEAALVRDILYVFQGIDGKYIKMNLADNCYKMDAKVPCAGSEGRGREKTAAKMKDLFDTIPEAKLPIG
jgi:tRNA A37 threonylcarbamoyladenosine dehydratase